MPYLSSAVPQKRYGSPAGSPPAEFRTDYSAFFYRLIPSHFGLALFSATLAWRFGNTINFYLSRLRQALSTFCFISTYDHSSLRWVLDSFLLALLLQATSCTLKIAYVHTRYNNLALLTRTCTINSGMTLGATYIPRYMYLVSQG